MKHKILQRAVLSGLLFATSFSGCEEEEDTFTLDDYCVEEYSDCLKGCSGAACISCESEYNNCVQLSEIYS